MRRLTLTHIFCGFCFILPGLLVLSSVAVVPFMLLIALCAAVAVWLSDHQFPLPRTVFSLLFAVLLLWAAIASLWTQEVGWALLLVLRIGTVILAGLFLIGLALRLEIAERRRVGLALLAGFALGVAILLIERTFHHPLHTLVAPLDTDKSPLSILNRGATGLAIMVWPVTALLYRGRLGAWALALPVLLFLVLCLLESQAALLGIAVGYLFGALAFAAIAFGRWTLGRTVLAAVLMVSVIGTPLAAKMIYDSGMRGSEFIDFASQHRIHIWKFTAERIVERPVFGWGFNSSRAIPNGDTVPFAEETKAIPSHPHNAVLQIWLELGVVGIAMLLAVLLTLAWRIDRLPGVDRISAVALLTCSFAIASVAYGIWQHRWIATLFCGALIIVLCRGAGIGGETRSQQDTRGHG